MTNTEFFDQAVIAIFAQLVAMSDADSSPSEASARYAVGRAKILLDARNQLGEEPELLLLSEDEARVLRAVLTDNNGRMIASVAKAFEGERVEILAELLRRLELAVP